MSSFTMCPTCFAEVYEQTECFFCGQDLTTSTEAEPEIVLQNTEERGSPFELAGLPLDVSDWSRIPKGTLLGARYSLLQYKQRLETGYCYIAYDNWLGRHTFVSVWHSASVLSQYHKSIQHISSVFDVGIVPAFSAFIPQEGLPLESALKKIGWTTGKVWEVFRQICQRIATVESRVTALPIYPPNHIWVRPDGQVEWSVQLYESADLETPLNHQLIALLGWLYDPTATLDLLQFPLKLRPLLLDFWERPSPVGDFWNSLNAEIKHGGWYRLTEGDRDWLLENHAPNRLLLLDAEIDVPSSVQVCIWNGAIGTWQLHQGQVLLSSSMEALFQIGMVELDDGDALLYRLEQRVMGETVECNPSNLSDLLMELRYGQRNKAREYLSEWIRECSRVSDWMSIAQTLYWIGDEKAADDIVKLALSDVDFLREGLDVATTVRWWGGNVVWTKRLLKRWWSLANTIWERTDWLEAWIALVHAEPPRTMVDQLLIQAEGLSPEMKTEWRTHVQQKFGNRTRQLFPFLTVSEQSDER